MLFKALSAAVFGIDAYLVEVEVDVGSGRMGDFNVVGLPDIAVKESRERIKAALKNCGFDFPAPQSVTVNLAPADIRKEGSGFDLPMALGIRWTSSSLMTSSSLRRIEGLYMREHAEWRRLFLATAGALAIAVAARVLDYTRAGSISGKAVSRNTIFVNAG